MTPAPGSVQIGALMPLQALGTDAVTRSVGASSFASTFEEAQQAARELVSTAFVKPILASLRDNPLGPKTGPFAQTAVDRRFGPLLDEKLADAVTSASNFSLVDAIVARTMPRGVVAGELDLRG